MKHSAELDQFEQQLLGDIALVDTELRLQLDDLIIQVRSNSTELLDQLRHYFRHLVVEQGATARVQPLVAIQRPSVTLEVPFTDWRREPGKTGRKDACYDFPGGRLVNKVRTGMVFLQSSQLPIAAGDCLANDNQVINFINAQWMTWLQQHQWRICHAAAVEYLGQATAIAAFSGGGKSTTMLRLMDTPDCKFLTNDRLFIRKPAAGSATMAAGVPKLPRINPGTIVNNSKLMSILSDQRRAAVQALPPDELWALEEKYDVDILATYGPDRIHHAATLGRLLILNWQRGAGTLSVEPIDLAQRPELLPAVMKSPGPFFQYADGRLYPGEQTLDPAPYLEALQDVPVYEVSGGVDFDGLVAWCRQSWG